MRKFFMLAAAVLAALPPAVAAAGHGDGSPSVAADPAAFRTQMASGSELTFPLPDAPGPAALAPGAQSLVDHASPGALLDLVVTLDRPADHRMVTALSRLGVWSQAFEHLPAAGIRLPLARLADLRNLRGVLAIYDDHPLHYFLKDSAKLNNTAHAWNDLKVTGKGVTVAILDTGVDFTHPDLAPAMKANVKLVGLGQDPVPVVPIAGIPNSDTSSGHGTHVAGDVAGRGIASGGAQKGMAYGADLVGIGTGDGLSVFTAVEGFNWLLENREKYGIRVVNNSYGTGFGPFDPMDPVAIATKRATDAGVVVVFANGNDADEMSMNPYAAAPWVIPVAAGAKSGKVADFSSGGIEADTVGMQFASTDVAGETRKPLSMGLYHPAVTTTGENVVSTRSNTTITPLTSGPEDIKNIPPEQIPYYHTLSGTSMASPETAGIVALILEADPALTPAQVRMVLQITARPIAGTPFWKQGYGYVDASGAVDLAQSLRGKSAAETESVLEGKQTATDQAVLDGLAHPSRSYGYTERAPLLIGKLTHKVEVAPGSERVKVISNGGSLPFVGVTSYDITVKDASGKEVGTTSASAASGTTALDLDLRKLDTDETKAVKRFTDLAFGAWTVEVGAVGTLVPPIDTGQVDDAAEKRFVTTLISVFGAQPRPCSTVAQFAPGAQKDYRFQDDRAPAMAVFPANPEFSYVGPLPDGALGNRGPERKLAATFGQATTTGKEPQFTTTPLTEPMTLGGAGEVRAFLQGPSEAVAGLLQADLIDVDEKSGVALIGSSPKDVAAKTSTTTPTETRVPIPIATPYTVPVGHRIGVRMRLTFVGTSGHTLFYDSTRYPSGVSIQTGQVITHEDCPHLIGTGPAPVGNSGSGPSATPPASDPPTTAPPPLVPGLPAVLPALPALPGAVPPLPALHDLAPLDQVGQKGSELLPEVGAVQGQLHGRPEKVDLLPDVVAPGLEGVTEDRLRL
ncbi:MAG: serine protease AprX [Actinomycetota bacterium]|nr:serine protease AprX [Actinomycetota bacterium]